MKLTTFPFLALSHTARRLMVALAVTAALLTLQSSSAWADFTRGDVNEDGVVDLSDGQRVLDYLFGGGSELACEDAADINDDGVVDVSDASALFSYLFLGGPAPPAPFEEAGFDPTVDGLACGEPACIPWTCQEAGVPCGLADDGCGGELECGSNCSVTTRSCSGGNVDALTCNCEGELGCECYSQQTTCGGSVGRTCYQSSLLVISGGGGCRTSGSDDAYCAAGNQTRYVCRGGCQAGTASQPARCRSGTYSCTRNSDCRSRDPFSYCSGGVCAR